MDKLPVKSVAAVIQTNTSALATLKSSGLDRPAKLAGKRYAGFGATYRGAGDLDGVEGRRRDQRASSRISRRTCRATRRWWRSRPISSGYIWAGRRSRRKLDGVELNTFLVKDYGVPDYYTPVIIANESFLRHHADVAKRFLAATAQGYEYGVTNPEEAADLL